MTGRTWFLQIEGLETETSSEQRMAQLAAPNILKPQPRANSNKKQSNHLKIITKTVSKVSLQLFKNKNKKQTNNNKKYVHLNIFHSFMCFMEVHGVSILFHPGPPLNFDGKAEMATPSFHAAARPCVGHGAP